MQIIIISQMDLAKDSLLLILYPQIPLILVPKAPVIAKAAVMAAIDSKTMAW